VAPPGALPALLSPLPPVPSLADFDRRAPASGDVDTVGEMPLSTATPRQTTLLSALGVLRTRVGDSHADAMWKG
jgi:hypothetical protein